MRREHDQGRIRSLAALARALSRSESLRHLLEHAAEEALRTLRAASVSVSRIEPDGVSVRTIVNVGDLGPDEVRWPDDETYEMDEFASLNLSADEPVTWHWVRGEPGIPDCEQVLLERLGKGSSLSAPLVVSGALWGEVYATRHIGAETFDQDDIAYLEAFLAILGGALARADREETLAQLAYHDPLTGLLNRRAIDDHARVAFEVPPGMRREVGVVALDINGLKQTNDRLGHQAGDELIQRVAGELVRSFADLKACVVGRVGGDEFTVLSVDLSTDPLVELADQLIARSWETDPTTALSGGVASAVLTEDKDLTPSEVFVAADRALYVAKRERRRTAVVADPL
ncbi:MAG TPA: sensor domain-containing diguanylate cyclase [Nocardioides sp.]|uniref:GGDEF domain-containing protein n=1 Tax=Nocardioides sp. TaxID=35761 RepID=UPI002D807298|nr:sensor domain-containing diguanylate cyclase [Nocardioides sp.]HET6651842.1 sensor domain-containing diguanylate cyclase [Nocardioides sp.]